MIKESTNCYVSEKQKNMRKLAKQHAKQVGDQLTNQLGDQLADILCKKWKIQLTISCMQPKAVSLEGNTREMKMKVLNYREVKEDGTDIGAQDDAMEIRVHGICHLQRLHIGEMHVVTKLSVLGEIP